MPNSPQGPYSPIYSQVKAQEMVVYYQKKLSEQFSNSDGYDAYSELLAQWKEYATNTDDRYRTK